MRLALTASLLCALAAACATAPATVEEATDPAFATTGDGIRVHYLDSGAAQNVAEGGAADDAIVLVHGWSCDVRTWHEQIPAFARHARVLAVDLPGHGRSDKPHVDYTMDLAAGAIAAAMDDAGVRRAVLIGHSNGTPVTRQFFRHHPERTLGIVVVDGALKPTFEDVSQAEQILAALDGEGRESFIGGFVDSMAATMTAADRAAIRAMMLETPAHVQRSVFEGAIDPTIWGDDPIPVPVLAVMAESPFWTDEYRAYVQDLAPDLDYRTWTGAGHFVHMERPEEFNALVLDWMRREDLL